MTGVLSIAKLRVGQEAYQLTGVAQSLDDYYTGAGEAAGVWAGTCAERTALHAAMTAKPKGAVESMAIVVPQVRGQKPVTPCGICRQALVEQERRQEGPIRLLMGITRGPVIEMFTVDALLPMSFDSGHLPGARRKKRS